MPWSLNSSAIGPFGRYQFCNQACSDQCGVMTISWKMCYDRHILHGISHKLLHKHHSLRDWRLPQVWLWCCSQRLSIRCFFVQHHCRLPLPKPVGLTTTPSSFFSCCTRNARFTNGSLGHVFLFAFLNWNLQLQTISIVANMGSSFSMIEAKQIKNYRRITR